MKNAQIGTGLIVCIWVSFTSGFLQGAGAVTPGSLNAVIMLSGFGTLVLGTIAGIKLRGMDKSE